MALLGTCWPHSSAQRAALMWPWTVKTRKWGRRRCQAGTWGIPPLLTKRKGVFNAGGAAETQHVSSVSRARPWLVPPSTLRLESAGLGLCARHEGREDAGASSPAPGHPRPGVGRSLCPHLTEAAEVVEGTRQKGMPCPSVLSRRSQPRHPAAVPHPPPPGTTAPQPEGGTGKLARGWRHRFPLCFTHNAPEKHVTDM